MLSASRLISATTSPRSRRRGRTATPVSSGGCRYRARCRSASPGSVSADGAGRQATSELWTAIRSGALSATADAATNTSISGGRCRRIVVARLCGTRSPDRGGPSSPQRWRSPGPFTTASIRLNLSHRSAKFGHKLDDLVLRPAAVVAASDRAPTKPQCPPCSRQPQVDAGVRRDLRNRETAATARTDRLRP